MKALLILLLLFALLHTRLGFVKILAERFRRWLEETHSLDFELRRHFFRRFFDSDLVSTPGQWKIVAGGILGVLLSLSIVFVQAYFHKYRELTGLDTPQPFEQAVVADALFLITLSMSIIGLFTTIQWPALFPGLRDYLALAALPIRPRQMFTAKFAALAGLVGLFTIAITAPPSLLLPMVMAGKYATHPAAEIVALFASTTLGALFVFFSLVAVQGVLLNILPLGLFGRISLSLQGVFLTILLCGLPLVFYIPDLQKIIDLHPPWAVWFPPAWFLGLHEVIVGNRFPLAVQLALLGAGAITAAAVLAVLGYIWSYHRHRKRILERPLDTAQSSGRTWLAPAGDRLIPDPAELAVFAFMSKTLMRSRQHRLILTAFAALAGALIFETFVTIVLTRGWHGLSDMSPALRRAAISVPLAFSLFIVSGFRYLFRLPVEVRANWIFRLNEPGNRARFLAAVERFLMWFAIAPVALVTLPLEMDLLGVAQGLAAAILCAQSSLILAEVLLAQFEKIPFTSSYLPGRRPVIETLLLYSFAVIAYISVWSIMLSRAVQTLSFTIVFSAVLLAVWLWIRNGRLRYRVDGRLEFEELPELAVQTLSIQRD